MPAPLLRKFDAVQFIGRGRETELTFCRDRLGHALPWRTERASGLAMAETDTELVLQAELREQDFAFLVDSADRAAARSVEAGGMLLSGLIDIPVGRVEVVKDPWGHKLVLLYLIKGTYEIDTEDNVTGVGRHDG